MTKRHEQSAFTFGTKSKTTGPLYEHRAKHLQRTYGISMGQYDKMLDEQKAVCAVCGGGNKTYGAHRSESLCVDHDHVTGKVRGLLCHMCNRAIGNMRDDAALISKLAEYIKRYQEE